MTATATMTRMQMEAAEAPARIADQIERNAPIMAGLAKTLSVRRPRLLMTCARGSSDHAATYAQYLFELNLGLPAASLPPSIASLFAADMDLRETVFLVISQSGQSPDLIAGADWARKRGAFVIAMVNAEGSPVADAADVVVPLHAGAETSVAATKSYLASLSAIAHFTAALGAGNGLDRAVADLPNTLERAAGLDWSAALGALQPASNAFVVGRGLGLAGASEMALKLKETSAMHAEAVSSAEIMHGPLGLLHSGLPILVNGQNDKTLESARTLVAVLREKGATVLPAFEGATGPHALPVLDGLDPAIAPLASVQSFYRMAAALAVARGHDPDNPEHLRKVTRTR